MMHAVLHLLEAGAIDPFRSFGHIGNDMAVSHGHGRAIVDYPDAKGVCVCTEREGADEAFAGVAGVAPGVRQEGRA